MRNPSFCQSRQRLNRAIASLDYYTNEAVNNCTDITDENFLVLVALNTQLQTWLTELKSFWDKKPVEPDDFLFTIPEGLTKAYGIAYNTDSEERSYTYLEIANWLNQLEMYRLLKNSENNLQDKIGFHLQ